MSSESRAAEVPALAGPTIGAGGARLVHRVSQFRELGLLAALALVVLVVGLQESRFVSFSNAEDILLAIAIVAIVAVGQTLVILTRNVDLSVASIVGLSAFVTADVMRLHHDLPLAAVIGLGLGIGLALGLVNGLLVTVGRVPAIVTTLGTLYIYRGLAFQYAEGKQVNAADVPERFLSLATNKVLGVPMLVLIALAVVAVFAYALRFTRSGRQLYAIGSNPDAARLVGVRRDTLVLGAFAICGLLAGLAGVLWAARYATVDARAASGLELAVIAAVVVGGVNINGGSGTVIGAFLGAVLLGTIQNALTILHLSEFWLQAIYGAVIIVAVVVDALIRRQVRRALVLGRAR